MLKVSRILSSLVFCTTACVAVHAAPASAGSSTSAPEPTAAQQLDQATKSAAFLYATTQAAVDVCNAPADLKKRYDALMVRMDSMVKSESARLLKTKPAGVTKDDINKVYPNYKQAFATVYADSKNKLSTADAGVKKQTCSEIVAKLPEVVSAFEQAMNAQTQQAGSKK